jgi:hypothetical protein
MTYLLLPLKQDDLLMLIFYTNISSLSKKFQEKIYYIRIIFIIINYFISYICFVILISIVILLIVIYIN